MNETTPDGNERKWIWQRPAIGFVLLIGFGRPENEAKLGKQTQYANGPGEPLLRFSPLRAARAILRTDAQKLQMERVPMCRFYRHFAHAAWRLRGGSFDREG